MSKTVLVVDDSPVNRKVLRTALRAEGYDVSEAPDGVEALEAMLGPAAFDAVVSDILMPRMDGYRLCFEIRRREREKAFVRPTVFIAYSATFVSPADEKVCRDMGADRFVRKPELSEVVAALRDLVGHRSESVLSAGAVPEAEVMREYSERLVLKLEKKNIELEIANEELRREAAHRARAESALAASETTYRRLFEAAKDGILILDFETGRVTDVNSFLVALLGLTRDEIVGRRFEEVSPFEEASAGDLRLERLQREGYVRHDDLPLETRDGRRIAVEFVSNAYESGGRSMIQCNIRDVTERKRAQDALRETESRYRDIFDASPLPKIMFALADFALLEVNEAAVSHYGYSREELLRMTFVELLAPGEESRFRESEARRAIGPQRPWKHRKKDGSTIDVEVFMRPLVEGGVRVGLAVIVDVTDRIRLEDQLRESQKLEAVGRLAGGVAHDFNNLMMVVQSVADVLPLHAARPGALEGDLKNLRMAAQRGAALTSQLLTFSRRHASEAEILNPASVVKELSPMIETLVGASIELRVRTAPADLRISVRRSHLEQVVMNLAVNARDAMPTGGVLSIDLAPVALDAAYAASRADVRAGDYVLLSVSDTGTGMAPEIRERIFEPFFTTKEVGRGTGLGLATSYGIVKDAGGHIGVYSEPGRGSVFKVYLPRVAAEVSPASLVGEWPGSLRGSERILLVEDESTIREMVQRYLEEKGYRVVTAADGTEALDRIGDVAGEIDVVVCDIVLPGRSAREVVSAAVARHPGARVILTSGYRDGAEDIIGTAPGVAFLEKPFRLDALARKIRSAMDPA